LLTFYKLEEIEVGKKTCMLGVRFTEEDSAAIYNLSKKEGLCMSAWVRRVVVAHLVKVGAKKKDRKQVTEYGR
jgi:hypothetical protein